MTGSGGRAGDCGAASWTSRVPRVTGSSSDGLLGLVVLGGHGGGGEGEEDVVEVGGVHGQLVGLDAGRVQPVEDGAQFALAAAAGDLQRQRLVVPGGLAQG